jgi:hypothetical protein
MVTSVLPEATVRVSKNRRDSTKPLSRRQNRGGCASHVALVQYVNIRLVCQICEASRAQVSQQQHRAACKTPKLPAFDGGLRLQYLVVSHGWIGPDDQTGTAAFCVFACP